MKIGPDVWGPHGWKFIHMIALAYSTNPTEEQRKNYKEFFTVLQHVLPCSLCANNYKRHITEELPLTDEVLKDRDSLSKWLIDIHNLVNKETGKKILSYDEALEMIYNNYETNKSNDNNINVPNIPVNMVPVEPNVLKNKIPTNIDFKKISKKIEEDSEKEETSTFTSVSFWILIFISLVKIAKVYKKESL